MSISFIIRRILFLFVVIWAASTIIFFIPRLSNKNPIRERFDQLSQSGGGYSGADLDAMVKSYNTKFGLDKPLIQQYLDYMNSLLHGDLGVSLNKYPRSVLDLIMDAIPWSIGLLFVTTILAFVIGNLLGAISAWPRSPGWLRTFSTPFVLLQGVPPVLMGVLLLFFVAFRLKAAPLGNAYSTGIVPTFSVSFGLDLLSHQMLPALALILGTVGGWVLSMRGMGVTIQGEDYVTYAEHKGLSGKTIFRDYYLRNAMLPQVTGLALAIGAVVTSGIVVEQTFALPGIGTTLFAAIQSNDFLVIYGIVLFITIAVATLMVVVELMYPLFDPRIRQQ